MIKRLKICFLLALCCIQQRIAQGKLPPELPQRPNIVWIVAEDMSSHLRSFGDDGVKTPNLDRLAADGVRYTQVYTTAGVCAPSRSSLITGMYQTAIGTGNMRTLSRPPGYKNPEAPDPYSAVLPEYVKGFPEYLRLNGYYCSNNAKQDYQFIAPVTMWDESSPRAHWRNRPEGIPFFSVFNLEVTHEAKLWERENEPLLVDPARVMVPPYYPDVPEVRQGIARHLSNVMIMDQQAGEIINQLKKDGLYDNTIIFFYTDHGDALPYVKREVLKRGLHVPLIIKFPGNQMAGSINRQMISLMDLGPTVLSLTQTIVPAYMHGQAFLGSQAVNPRRYIFAGRDRMDTEYDRVRTVLDTHYQYIRNYYPGRPRYQEIEYRKNIPMMKRILNMRDSNLLNKTQMRWFEKDKPSEELYDLKSDPYELHNLAFNPKYRKVLETYRKAFNDWMSKVGDRSEIPEKEMVQQMWNGSSVQPATATPQYTVTPSGIVITCATRGASIGYKINSADAPDNAANWKVYNNIPIALQAGDKMIIRAERIGYKPGILTFTFK
ncbi:sulfatase family protein [Niabella aquatica]